MQVIPTVKVNDDGIERYYDIFSMLLQKRIIMLSGEINDDLAQIVISELLYLDSKDNKEPIHLYINSPGGSCVSGTAIIDTMNMINAPVHTLNIGMAASMASVILSAGEKGHRNMLEHASIMLHQASGGNRGNVQDIGIDYENMIHTNEQLLKILANNCHKTVDEMKELTIRDYWIYSDTAVDFKIVDKIIKK